MSYSFLLKFIIIGDSGVGKSCLLLQYTDQRYREQHQVTIGVQFGAKLLKLNGNNIKLQIWDTVIHVNIKAGQESFKAITRGYYRNAIGAILCYDITNRESFKHLAKWLEEARLNGNDCLNFILVGNKSDRPSERKVSYQQGLRFAKQQMIPFVQSSAKSGNNVCEIFHILTESVLRKIEQNQMEIKDHPGIKIGNQKYKASEQSFNGGQIGRISKKQVLEINQGHGDKKKNKKCCQ